MRNNSWISTLAISLSVTALITVISNPVTPTKPAKAEPTIGKRIVKKMIVTRHGEFDYYMAIAADHTHVELDWKTWALLEEEDTYHAPQNKWIK